LADVGNWPTGGDSQVVPERSGYKGTAATGTTRAARSPGVYAGPIPPASAPPVRRLGPIADDLVSRSVALIVAGGAAAGLAARAVTATIPIVLVSGSDPASLGLAPSLGPGGNMTGGAFTASGLMGKRLYMLRELVPQATTAGYLAEDGRAYNSDSPLLRKIEELEREILTVAGALGGKLSWRRSAATAT